jgi:asparagine synthase (glutamine-hydrolysing)
MRGNAFLGGTLLDNAALSDLFPRKMSHEEFLSILRKLNGFFCFVLIRDESIYATVDRLRSMPLFYYLKGGHISISDDPYWIRQQMKNSHVDTNSAVEFLLTGYVTGRETLFNCVKQIKAGEVLIAAPNQDISIVKYYHHTHADFIQRSTEDLLFQLDESMTRSFKRLLRIADGKTIIVPLSGGYDSRLVVLMLKKLGYANVLSFSYGRPYNKESRISKKLAKCLGFDWIFIEYTNEKWRQWYHSEDWEAYTKIASNLTSTPFFRDWPAVLQMKEQELIPADSIFVPGHVGLLAGGMINTSLEEERIKTAKELRELIYISHYNLWGPRGRKIYSRPEFKDKIDGIVGNALIHDGETAADAYERWVLEERSSKYIINGVRAYEFFGYKWWLPLCDYELMDFWLKISLDKRKRRTLYKNYINSLLLKLVDREIKTMKKERYSAMNICRSCLRRLSVLPFAGKACFGMRQLLEYKGHPLAFFGIVPYKKFKIIYTGNEIRTSFFALDALAELSDNSAELNKIIAPMGMKIVDSPLSKSLENITIIDHNTK